MPQVICMETKYYETYIIILHYNYWRVWIERKPQGERKRKIYDVSKVGMTILT